MNSPVKDNTEYRDGINAARCLFCGTVTRLGDDAPVSSVRTADVERLVVFLADLNRPATWGDLQKRLEQACGRTPQQLRKVLNNANV